MSRPRHASSHSRGNSPPGDRKLSATVATFQDLHLDDSVASQNLSIQSTYQPSNPPYRPSSSDPQTVVSPHFLETAYDDSGYRRNTPSENFIHPLRTSPAPAFGISDPDPLTFPIDPAAPTYHVPPTPPDPAELRSNMSYIYSSDSHYHRGEQGSYASSRSPAMAEYAFSSPEARRSGEICKNVAANPMSKVKRTWMPSTSGARPLEMWGASIDSITASTASSYELSPNLGSLPYGRTGSVSSSHGGQYIGSISGSPTAYNDMHYQAGYGLESVNPQTMYNPTGGPGQSSIPNPAPQPGYRRPSATPSTLEEPQAIRILEPRSRPQCWEHGCNGRQFSTFSNLLRHQREKSGTATKSYCPRCGAEFTRTTARNGHLAHDKCTKRSTDDQ